MPDGHLEPHARLRSHQRDAIADAPQAKYGNRYELNFTAGSPARSTAQLMADYANGIGAG